jgi:predicted nuclease with RNAse H fold
MLTVGVDLAAEAARTAIAWVDWSTDGACVRDIKVGADDNLIIEALLTADKAGIDCPLGWPDQFVSFVSAHRSGHVDVPNDIPGRDWRRHLALRVTDHAVHDLTGLTPLSVSADRIGHTAMRCAALLAQLARHGAPVNRDGSGVVCEVYPAASLHLWGLPHRGYKRTPNLARLGHLVDALKTAAPWMDLGPHEATCRTSDDATDALIAAITAHAAFKGLTTTPTREHADTARTEGWITLPTTSLHEIHP